MTAAYKFTFLMLVWLVLEIACLLLCQLWYMLVVVKSWA